MVPIVPRRALHALFTYARSVPLAPTTGVSPRAMRAVLVAFLDADSWSGAFPAVPTLATRAECSVRTARRALRALEAAGVIATELGGGRKSSRYRLVRPAAAAGPGPVARQPGQDGRRSPVSTSPPSSCGRRRRPAAAPSPKRIRAIPPDLQDLASALVGRGLRAAFGLTEQQLADVRAAVARCGVSTLVAAAYRAHRASDPARWWSAWLDIWGGLHAPTVAAPRTAAAAVPMGDGAAGSTAVRAALASYRPIAY